MRLEDDLRNLRCPNEPEDKEGLVFSEDKHEVFLRSFDVTLTASYLPNGRQWGLDRPESAPSNVRPITPITCKTCGAEAEVKPWKYEPVESEDPAQPGWKQMAIE